MNTKKKQKSKDGFVHEKHGVYHYTGGYDNNGHCMFCGSLGKHYNGCAGLTTKNR